MGLEIKKEHFVGKYDGVAPATLLPRGWIAGGKNVRKVAGFGGWKARKGCLLNNTTAAETGSAVKSLHLYKNPINNDRHFIAQVNSKLLEATNDPPAAGTTFGTDLGVTVGTTPGFSMEIDEYFVYADGSGIPIIYGGTTPAPMAFFAWDNSESTYVDYTRKVTDNRTNTQAIVLGAANDKIYIVSRQIIKAFTLDLGTNVNSNAETMTVKSWQSGSWAAVTSMSDGTLDSGKTLAVDGTVSWTEDSSDEMRIISGVLGYAYEVSFSGALSGSIDVISCTVTQDAAAITNKWNGVYEWAAGCRYYDQSADEYLDVIAKVSTTSTNDFVDISSATTSDYLYIKTFEPATGFGLGIPAGFTNTDAAKIDQIDYWDGDSWTAITTGITDGTLDGGDANSFTNTGAIFFDGSATTPQRRILEGDPVPGYWYRISWDVALSSDVRIFMLVYATFPEAIPFYDGCVEFKSRAFFWGDPEFPNRLRFTATNRPDVLSGSDSGYTQAFGGEDKILCAIPFYNELLVFKKSGVWLLEGYSPNTFGTLRVTASVGLSSPKTALVAEAGAPDMTSTESVTVAIWQAEDGVYVFDGRKPKKVSLPVDDYFNPELANVIAAASIDSLQSFLDPVNNEYHLLIPSGELVYNYVTDEWYPPWSRSIPITTGISLIGTDNRKYTYGASADGFVFRLENDTADKNSSNADVAIDHSIKSRAIGSEEEAGVVFSSTLRHIWAQLKTRSAGSITTKTFKDIASSGVTQTTPSAMSMVGASTNMISPQLDMNIQNITAFQVEFSLAVIDQEMEIWSMTYESEKRKYTGT